MAECLVAQRAEGGQEYHHYDHYCAQKTEERLRFLHGASEVEDDAVPLEIKDSDPEEVRQAQRIEQIDLLIVVMVFDLDVVLVEDDPEGEENSKVGNERWVGEMSYAREPHDGEHDEEGTQDVEPLESA